MNMGWCVFGEYPVWGGVQGKRKEKPQHLDSYFEHIPMWTLFSVHWILFGFDVQNFENCSAREADVSGAGGGDPRKERRNGRRQVGRVASQNLRSTPKTVHSMSHPLLSTGEKRKTVLHFGGQNLGPFRWHKASPGPKKKPKGQPESRNAKTTPKISFIMEHGTASFTPVPSSVEFVNLVIFGFEAKLAFNSPGKANPWVY